jgi:hypothetical protein
VLFKLSDAKQREIVEALERERLSDVQMRLGEEGIKTSVSSLSEFRKRYLLRLKAREYDMGRNEALARIRERMAEERGMPPDELFAFAVTEFSKQALLEGSIMQWQRMQKLRMNAERTGIDRRRFALEIKKMLSQPPMNQGRQPGREEGR